MIRNVPLAVLCIAATLAAASCAGRRDAARAPDFLGDTPMLRPAADDPAARVWFDPAVDFTQYSRLLIDPVEVVLVPGADAASLDPALLAGLAAEFRATLVRVVDPYYDVLDAPAPRTLRIRAALTDARLRPGGRSSADLVDARVEWMALDAMTGRRVGAGIRRRESRPDAPGFDPWAFALLDVMDCRQVLGAGAPR